MIAYAIIFYIVGIIFLFIGVAIYKGKTNLIHSYHQENVTDHKNYGKAMGKAMLGIGISMFLGATISLFGEALIWLSLGVFVVGFIAMFIWFVFIQKKYNLEVCLVNQALSYRRFMYYAAKTPLVSKQYFLLCRFFRGK